MTTTVGFVIGDLTNPFYTLVAAGVERVLARDGLTLVIAATDDESRLEASVVSAMLERRIRALLLVPIADDHGYLEGERQFGTPIVAVDRPLSNAVSDSVVFDNRNGAKNGVLALLDAGHRRVAFVGSSESLYTGSAFVGTARRWTCAVLRLSPGSSAPMDPTSPQRPPPPPTC